MEMKYTRTTITIITTKIAIAIKSPAAKERSLSSSVFSVSLFSKLLQENDELKSSLNSLLE